MNRKAPILSLTLLLTGCFQSEGGNVQPLPGIDSGTASCGIALPCPSGSICHPTGTCIQCPGGTCSFDQGLGRDAHILDGAVDAAPLIDRDMQVSKDSRPRVDSSPASDTGVPTDGETTLPDVCIPQDELCNALDDDCDDLIDETYNILTDPQNCGTCGVICGPYANANPTCTDGQCAMDACNPGWLNEDNIDQNGCEFAERSISLLSPIGDGAYAGAFQIVVAMTAFEDLGHVEVRGNGQLIARRVPAERIEIEIDEREFEEGALILSAVSYDLMGEVVSRASMEILIDRTGPTITFIAPGIDLINGTDEFDIVINVVDNAPPVAVDFHADIRQLGHVDAPPYRQTVDPTSLGPGPHTLRVVAIDRAGNRSEATRNIRLSFCAEDEMTRIPDTDVLMDLFENSRPDATPANGGTDESQACSQHGVIPWQQLDYFAAEAHCTDSNKRLCTLDEWRQACGGSARRQFPYAGRYDGMRCNGLDRDIDEATVIPTGHLNGCQTPEGIADLSGNLAEWTSSDRHSVGVNGGDYRSNLVELACDGLREYQPATIRATHGFRCCRDLQE